MKKTLIAVNALLFSVAQSSWAAGLGANSASIVQDISVPGMAVVVNPGGEGCNSAAHEVWTPAQNGCSDIEYQKSTARVVSVTPGTAEVEAGTGATALQAIVVMANGKRAPGGVPVFWSTSNGNLAVPQSMTDDLGETTNKLSAATSGISSVTASAAGGSAATSVVVTSSTPIITSVRSDQMNLHDGNLESPWRVYWSSPNQTADTTIKISFEHPSYCYTQNPKHEGLEYFPTPGSTSWLINGSQTIYKRVVEPAYGIWCPNALKVYVTLCNGDSCASSYTIPKQSYTTDSM